MNIANILDDWVICAALVGPFLVELAGIYIYLGAVLGRDRHFILQYEPLLYQ